MGYVYLGDMARDDLDHWAQRFSADLGSGIDRAPFDRTVRRTLKDIRGLLDRGLTFPTLVAALARRGALRPDGRPYTADQLYMAVKRATLRRREVGPLVETLSRQPVGPRSGGAPVSTVRSGVAKQLLQSVNDPVELGVSGAAAPGPNDLILNSAEDDSFSERNQEPASGYGPRRLAETDLEISEVELKAARSRLLRP